MAVYGISCLVNGSKAPDANTATTAIQHASAFLFEILAKFRTDDTRTTQRLQGIDTYGISTNELYAGIAQQLVETTSNEISRVNDEHHRRIDYVKTLFRKGHFFQAVQYLESIKNELWYQADSQIRYRLLISLGMAKLGLEETTEATINLIEALQYNPEDDGALAHAAMAYVLQGDYTNAKALVDRALKKNPANTLAYSERVRMVPTTEPIETVLEQIPQAYWESPDILVALGEAALNRGFYDKAEEWLQSALTHSNGSNMDSVKVTLGIILIEPLGKNYPLIAAGQLQDFQRERLEQAETLSTGQKKERSLEIGFIVGGRIENNVS